MNDINQPIPVTDIFVSAFSSLANTVWERACLTGWWDDREDLRRAAEFIDKMQDVPWDGHQKDKFRIENIARRAVMSQMLGLIHSEVSEALENIRHDEEPDDKIPEFSGLEAELADVIIRIMDMSEGFKLKVAEAVVAKIAMNNGRPKMHGGKKF